ncbi:MAG TPA: HD domain-containing phosphohydrolase [Candidatus Sulfotelmatobacter sp.]|nr:HD domain-containing phosphohydrolase [Candidatus Sulfotelmatobacter sp.]
MLIPSTIVGAPSLALVYPEGLALPAPAASALDAAGIVHRAAPFPYAGEHAGRAVVYLVDEGRLLRLGARPAVERALALIARTQNATTVVLAESPSRAPWLAECADVGGWVTSPPDGAALVATVRAAAARLAAHGEIQALHGEADHLLRIGLALSAERDIVKLESTIVRSARELTHADSGSLYLLEDGDDGERVLRFAVAQTGPHDRGTYLGAVLPLSRTSISGYVAISGETVRVDDAYTIPENAEYKFNPSFDRANGYRTKSVLAVPMRDHENTIVGVIMLLNRKPAFEVVLESPAHTEAVVEPFTDRDERVLRSLASQAGVALENKALLDGIQDLFEQFVRASVKAIEVRDKSTQGHSERVAELTVLQAEAINAVASGTLSALHFDADQLREMRYAALLHDFGKVAVPEYIFGKAKKLPDGRLDTIRLRFLLAIEQTTDEHRRAQLRELLASVEGANEPRVVAAEIGDVLDALARMTYRELDGEKPLLDEAELAFLRIPRGSLSVDERRAMEQHVTQSFYFLREIPWMRTPWRNVAELAYGHHEHLDGTGYPRGLRGSEIAPQVRLLTISDVFDALTANDRPYKPAITVERALDILVKEFADRGKIDRELLDLFIARKVYEPVVASRS